MPMYVNDAMQLMCVEVKVDNLKNYSEQVRERMDIVWNTAKDDKGRVFVRDILRILSGELKSMLKNDGLMTADDIDNLAHSTAILEQRHMRGEHKQRMKEDLNLLIGIIFGKDVLNSWITNTKGIRVGGGKTYGR